MGAITGMVLGVSLLLSGCGAAAPSKPALLTIRDDAAPSKPVNAVLLTIRDDAASGPDFWEHGRIENAADADYFILRLRREFASVIVMTTGTTDTAGRVETAGRMPVTEACDRDEPVGPCVFTYDSDTAPNEERSDAFNNMEPSGNFVWEGNLPGPEGDEEYRAYYIRVTGENGATGGYVLTVELNEGEGPLYSR